ncbi:MAG: ABC transporter ATP-binding protein [Candidatus Heimdallarchaeota archaeon]
MSSANAAAIDIQDLQKVYSGFSAVSGISLTIERGEIFGLLGPNGAGKSTTTNIISGRISPTGGKTTVYGFDVSKETSKVKHILGVAPQEIALYDHLTAREMLYLMGNLYGVPQPSLNARIEELLEFSGLLTKNGRIGIFSGGMKRRLNLVASMVHDPEILLLDEPTVGVDPQQRRRIWSMILKLKERGKTVVLTTHLMDEADRLCDRIAIMESGKIIALDSPTNFKRRLGGEQVIDIVSDQPRILSEELEKIKGISRVEDSKRFADDWEEPFGRLRLVSTTGVDLLPAVIFAAQQTRAKIESVVAREVNLDDVFIALTGRSLREEEEPQW